MTTATGDYAIDWSGVSDIDPYTNADFTAENGDFEIISGSLRPNGHSSPRFFAYTGQVVVGDVYSAKIEINHDNTVFHDVCGPAILDSSGNGYWLALHGSITRLRRVAAYTPTYIASVDVAYASGDVFELTVDVSTGAIAGSKNGVEYTSATDLTYSTGLRAGHYGEWTNSNAHGAISFASDGYAPAAASGSNPITLASSASEQTVQAMVATSVTTAGSVFDSSMIAVEDDMQVTAPLTVAPATYFTIAADGTYTHDADTTIVIPLKFYSPTTEQLSYAELTLESIALDQSTILTSVMSPILSTPLNK